MIILDRIEGDTAILTGGENKVYEVSCGMLPEGARENDSFEAVFVGNNIIDLVPAQNPESGKNKSRLQKLFNGNK